MTFNPKCPTPDLLSATETAKYLGVSRGCVYRYRDRGYLSPVSECGTIRFARAEVEALTEQTSRGRITRPSPQHSALLNAELRELEDQLGMIEFVLDNNHTPLNFDDAEVCSLYRQAEKFSCHGCPPELEREWLKFLLRLRSTDMRQIERAVGTEDAVLPFLNLGRTMATTVSGTLGPVLRLAFANIVRVACECNELKKGGKRAWSRELKELSCTDENQMRRVARLNAKRATKTTERREPLSESDERLRAMLREYEEWLASQENQETTEQTGPAIDNS